MSAWNAFFHPRRVSRELAAAEAELISLADSNAQHAANAQQLRDELHEVRQTVDELRARLAESEKSANNTAEELLGALRRCEDTDRLLRQEREENALLRSRLADSQNEHQAFEEQFKAFEERLTQAENMRASYMARINALKDELARLRAEAAQSASDDDTDWFSLPPNL